MLLLREGTQRAADYDETPAAGEAPADYVVRVARIKAQAGWSRLEQRRLMRFPVLSADTTVTLESRIFGKPTSRDQAAAFLRAHASLFPKPPGLAFVSSANCAAPAPA